MTKKENTDKVEIKIDGKPYMVDPAVRQMLGAATQVRDILANSIVEWNNGYFEVRKEEGKEEFHWTELKLKEIVDKLLNENREGYGVDTRPTPEIEGDKN